jgi:hypothetical protein
MALFLLENRDFSVFQMTFKVWLNQIFSNFNTLLLSIKYELNLYLMVRSIGWKFENIWLSHTLNIIRKPKKFLFSKRKRAIAQERWKWNTNVIKLSDIDLCHKIQDMFDYGVFHIYSSWAMALYLLENRDFLGFRMIFKT